MDILTLGKMNAMSRNTDLALELMANHVYEAQNEICAFQTGNVDAINTRVAEGIVELGDYTATHTSTDQKHFFIYNTDHWSPLNGGCCLQWTVPTGTSIINFEILSGGGPGGSAGHDYDTGHGGAGGNYNEKTLCREAGDFNSIAGLESVYSLCAAGTSQCSCCTTCNRACRHGCSSYVTGDGLTNFCAIGGHGGSTSWDILSNCYNCFRGNIQCDVGNYSAGWTANNCNEATQGGDMCFRGIAGSYQRGYSCCNETQNHNGGPAGPFTVSGSGIGGNACTGGSACCHSHSAFPGGGGTGASHAAGTACVGGFGAGGLVKVTYQ
jgi:hypothetical protein